MTLPLNLSRGSSTNSVQALLDWSKRMRSLVNTTVERVTANDTTIAAIQTELASVATALTSLSDGLEGVSNDVQAVADTQAEDALLRHYVLPVMAGTTALVGSATIYLGNLLVEALESAAIRRIYVPFDGTIRRVELTVATTLAGSDENWTAYVRVNNTTDHAIATVGESDTTRRFSNADMDVAVNAGDYFEIKVINPGWSVPPGDATFGGYVSIE